MRGPRERLLEAAFAYAMDGDLTQLEIATLAKIAEVPLGAARRCFDGRAALIIALHRYFLDRVLREVAPQAAVSAPSVERVCRGISMFLDYCLRHAPLRRQLLALEQTMPGLSTSADARRSGFRVMLTMELAALGIDRRIEFGRLLRVLIEEVSLIEIEQGTVQPMLREQVRRFIEMQLKGSAV